MKKLYKPLNTGIKRILTIVTVLIPAVTLAALGNELEHPAELIPIIIIPIFAFWTFVFVILWVRQGFLDNKK